MLNHFHLNLIQRAITEHFENDQVSDPDNRQCKSDQHPPPSSMYRIINSLKRLFGRFRSYFVGFIQKRFDHNFFAEDSESQIEYSVRRFEECFGPTGLKFTTKTFSDAIEEADEKKKLLFIYIHDFSERNGNARDFCRFTDFKITNELAPIFVDTNHISLFKIRSTSMSN